MKNLILLNFGLLLILIGSANSECCDRCDNTAHCPNGDACGVPQIQCCSYGACNIFCCNCGGSCRKEYSSTSPNRTASTIINDVDEDGDKKLSCQEVKKYLKYGDILSCNGGEEQNWFKHMDQNNDGFLEGNEIDEDYQNPKSPNNQASFESVFFYHEKRVNSFNEGLDTMENIAIDHFDNDEIEEFSNLGYDTTNIGFGKCLTCAAKIMKAVYKCRHDSHKLKCVRDAIGHHSKCFACICKIAPQIC